MGVKSLWEILGPTARPVRLEALSRKKLAVDASIWIYQFLKAVRDGEGNAMAQSHIIGFFRRICKLLYFGIQPVFVFDGGAPALKRETINKRKQRRQGKSESTRQTAQKLLAIQVRRQAESYHQGSKNTRKDQLEDDEDGDVIYLQDLPMNQSGDSPKEKSPVNAIRQNEQETGSKSKRFIKKDEYHLPEIQEFNVRTSDGRVMPEDEFNESLAGLDFVDGIDINKVDPNSKEFLDFPLETQYMILSNLRLRSRLRMGYRKEQLEALFPNSMDFSKFQIQQVQKRNFYTQKLMTVAGMGDDDTINKRIAGDKDRKYALIKNDDGWTLSIDNQNSENEPITLDEDGNEIKNVVASPVAERQTDQKQHEVVSIEDSDEDFEDVELDVEETEEEKNRQKALIESIYEQYQQPDSNMFPDGFSQSDIQKALEASKADKAAPAKIAPEIRKSEAARIASSEAKKTEPSFSLGGSFLFPTKPISFSNSEPEDLRAKEVTTPKKKDDKSGKEKIEIDSKEHENVSETGSNKKTVLVKEEEEEEEIQSKVQEKIYSSDTARDAQEVDFEAEKEVDTGGALKGDILEEFGDAGHENSKDRETETPKEIEKEVAEKDNAIRKPTNEIPSWFNQQVTTTTIPKPIKPVQTHEHDEDEDAGLIPWNEANEYMNPSDQDQNEKEYDDDIEEIAPPIESSKTTPKSPDTEVEKPQSSPKSSTGPQRKAQIIDYDFEDEDNVVQQLRNEEEDHESFRAKIQEAVPLSPIINTSITEEQLLQEKLNKAKRDAEEVTQTMISDVQELLRRFGIPYITAPMEAEAQCAELLKIGLVDGIITDDSDCFLFGGDKVYKNMFNQKQYVECYIMSEIEDKIGVNQNKLIELALLLGSDYTEGIKGIGPVLAMEILAEFGSLRQFKKWFDQQTVSLSKASEESSVKKTLLNRMKNGKLFLPDSFPDQVVFDAYKSAEVDHDKSEFKWGVPSLDQIRSYLMYNVGWSQGRVDEVMVPLIRDINRKKQSGVQTTIGEFFPQEYIKTRKEIGLGKRIKTAADKLNKRTKVD